MRRKLVSLILALAMCLSLTTMAMAMQISNEKCTYELSNAPIGTVEMPRTGWYQEVPEGAETMTAYVVPDNTTVESKTAPSGEMPYDTYWFEDSEWVGGLGTDAPLAIEPVMLLGEFDEEGNPIGDSMRKTVAYWVYSEELEFADYEACGLCLVAESAAKSAGLTINPYTPGTAPSSPSEPTVPAEPAPSFTDVSAGDYFAAPVAWAVEKEITNGTGDHQFSPNQNCTNAQILTFLWRAYGKPEPTISNPFTNDIPDAYAKVAVWAYEKGMVSGDAFDVDGLCSRSLAVTYMWQAAGAPESEMSPSFTDVPADAAFAAAVNWAVETGVTTGTSDTTFSPDDTCTRGQIVTFLHRNLA